MTICQPEILNFAQIDSRAMVHALETIMTRFYQHRTSTVFIMEQSSRTMHRGLGPREIVNELIRSERNRTTMTYVIENHVTVSHVKYYRAFNVFVVENYDSFRRIFSEMTAKTYDYSGFYTIVLTEHSDDCQETITAILRDCWTLYIANVNILTPTEDYETVLLYTYFPYTPEHCECVKPVVHDYFENGTFILNEPIFPDKFRNFYKCSIRMSTYRYKPFMILTLQPNGSYHMDGIEGRLFRVMAKRLNFTPIAVLSAFNYDKNATRLAAHLKKTLPRSLDRVLDGSTNLSIGAAIPRASRIDVFSVSHSYFYGSLLYAIPSGKPYSSLEKLYFPFKIRVWVCICTLFGVAIMIIIALKLAPNQIRDFFIGKSNDIPFFNMINISLGGTISVNTVPIRNFARTMLLIWLLATLVIRNAYQGKLFDNLRGNQRMNPLYTLDKLYASTVKVYVYSSYYASVSEFVSMDRLSIYDANVNILYNFTDDNFNSAVMIISQTLDYFNFLNYPKINVLKTKEYIQSLPFCIHFRKHSCLVKPFNDQISAYMSSGLINFWAKQYSKQHQHIQNNNDDMHVEATPLSIHQFVGVITICGYLIAVSIILFIFEVMSDSFEGVKIVLDFFTFNVKQIGRGPFFQNRYSH